ncbi:MAG: GNAT family N-acetyltransferase [Chloroflexota bacterium]|nr:GNAT family N-acetyltransferase [Chloroflexota bacterium]
MADLQEGPRADRWREIISNDATHVWVALDEGVVVGWASASAGRDDDAPHPWELEGIYVLSSHHGSGIGQALLDASIDQRPAYLWMAADNPRAHAFYRRNGFRHDGATATKDLAGSRVEVIRLSR